MVIQNFPDSKFISTLFGSSNHSMLQAEGGHKGVQRRTSNRKNKLDTTCGKRGCILIQLNTNWHIKEPFFEYHRSFLLGGFNPLEKYVSNWIISPGVKIKNTCVATNQLQPKRVSSPCFSQFLSTSKPQKVRKPQPSFCWSFKKEFPPLSWRFTSSVDWG